MRREAKSALLQLTRMTATGSGQTMMDMQYTFSGDAEQRTDHAIDGRGERRDGGVHLRHVEPSDESRDDQRRVGGCVHLRRIWEPDGEDADQGNCALDDSLVRSGDESSGRADLRCEREPRI